MPSPVLIAAATSAAVVLLSANLVRAADPTSTAAPTPTSAPGSAAASAPARAPLSATAPSAAGAIGEPRAIADGRPITDPRAILTNRPPLAPTPFLRLPIGSVRAEGWLRRQLELQRDGLTGSAEQLYDALTPESGWLGGNGEGWEKGPYYVKGLIALAHTLDDPDLKQRAQKWIDWTLQSQRPDGFFGPASNDDWWPRMVVLFYLRDHYEATGDPRVMPFLLNYFRHQLSALPKRPLVEWGKARAGDNLDVVLWAYNRTGEPFLLDLARLLNEQAYPWSSIFADNRFYDFGQDFHPHHIVNVTQAIKMPAVAWQLTRRDADREAIARGVAHLERQYGRIDGQFSGTEMLSGRRSTDGVELCADVERILSNGIAVTILGDAALGDQMERVAYNSLPAHTSPEMRQMTYYQLPNQVMATHGGHGFQQDYSNGNVPGPHSGFPCCCYNWHFGWPKLVEHMWAATADGGLALIAYGPNRVTTTVNGDVPITVTQTTDYPFAEVVKLTIEPGRPATFPLSVRLPAWCASPMIRVNGQAVAGEGADDGAGAGGAKPGTFHRIEREWRAGDVVELTFPMTVRASTWTKNSVGLERGPLAFGLRIGEQWQRSNDLLKDFDEFEVRPTTPWNYALQIGDRARPEVTVRTRSIGDVPFANDAAPVTLEVNARRLPAWGLRTLPGTVTLGRADGAWHKLADAGVPLEPEVPHRVRVEARGKLIRVFVDDMSRPLIDKEDETLAAGGVGLRAYQSSARFDDVRIDGELVADFETGADGWQTFGGRWRATDGAYAVEQPRGDAKAVLADRQVRDFTFEATITLRAAGDAGLIFRASDATERLDGYRGYYVGLTARQGASEDAQEPPPSPVRSAEALETVELIPFGSSKLRVSYFPVLGE